MARKETAAAAGAPVEITVTVRFLVRDAPWDAGDVVALSLDQAEKLERHGVAERVE